MAANNVLIDAIKNMTAPELAEFLKALQAEWERLGFVPPVQKVD